VRTISGTFATRSGAELAIEHLVQEHDIGRADIFVQAQGDAGWAGKARSGADASSSELEGSEFEPALRGSILVSADVALEKLSEAEQAFRDAGASDIRRG